MKRYEPGKEIGIYLVAESIDGGGKGTIINGLKNYYAEQGKTIIDLREEWLGKGEIKKSILEEIYNTRDVIPHYSDIKKKLGETGKKLDLLVLCEPTWAGVGLRIRKKIIHEIEGVEFKAEDTAKAYALDRQIFLCNTILPAIMDGVDVICERNYCSSIVYQSTMDDGELKVEEILEYPGNMLAIMNRPDIYVICNVEPITAIKRLAKREKKDECKFEKKEFQEKIHKKYQSEWLRKMLESHGSTVVYMNTNEPLTEKDTITAAIEILELFKKGEVNSGDLFNC